MQAAESSRKNTPAQEQWEAMAKTMRKAMETNEKRGCDAISGEASVWDRARSQPQKTADEARPESTRTNPRLGFQHANWRPEEQAREKKGARYPRFTCAENVTHRPCSRMGCSRITAHRSRPARDRHIERAGRVYPDPRAPPFGLRDLPLVPPHPEELATDVGFPGAASIAILAAVWIFATFRGRGGGQACRARAASWATGVISTGWRLPVSAPRPLFGESGHRLVASGGPARAHEPT
jgi:hypothetical protein